MPVPSTNRVPVASVATSNHLLKLGRGPVVPPIPGRSRRLLGPTPVLLLLLAVSRRGRPRVLARPLLLTAASACSPRVASLLGGSPPAGSPLLLLLATDGCHGAGAGSPGVPRGCLLASLVLTAFK